MNYQARRKPWQNKDKVSRSSRRVFPENISLQEAWEKWGKVLESIRPLPSEEIPVIHSLGRITAEPVIALNSSPFYNSSAMDGFAVRFEDTFGASETTPVRLKIGPEAVEVNTGDPLPEGFNAVLMIEDLQIENGYITFHAPATPYQNVRSVGEDIVKTELILPENHQIRPVDIGAMLAGGNTRVLVRKMPRAVIIPTGNEIIDPGTPLEKGKIIDYDSFMIGAIIEASGGTFERVDVVPDSKELLKKTISDCLDKSDFVVTIAGSSAGTRDFCPDAIAELGDVLVHGIRIRPGKPVLLGLINEKPVLGIPGYPVSAYITFELFGIPLINRLRGLPDPPEERITAHISRPVSSTPGKEEFLRVKLGRVRDKFMATPVGRGAGALMSLQRADGIVRIPELSEGAAPGSEVTVRLLRPLHEIENTLVMIGSHDISIDILSNWLKKTHPSFSLSSAHVGSMGGILAIKRGEAHLAGTHLLDEETGEYNIPFIRKLLPDLPLRLVTFLRRQQGLIVPKGNPRGITGIQDLTRDDIVFINRQKGSGTRLLTDKCIREAGLDPSEIRGYEREEFTHMGVASSVLSGVADTGMGILTSAIALDLDFIPVATERYDIIVPGEFDGFPPLAALLEIIRKDGEFRKSVLSLGGYEVDDMGKVVYEQ